MKNSVTRDAFLAIVAVIAALVPFLNKAFHIDDPLFMPPSLNRGRSLLAESQSSSPFSHYSISGIARGLTSRTDVILRQRPQEFVSDIGGIPSAEGSGFIPTLFQSIIHAMPQSLSKVIIHTLFCYE